MLAAMRLAVFLIAAAGIGAYVALFVRALIGQHAHRRIDRAAAQLEPEHLARLRAYIAEMDAHERGRLDLGVVRDPRDSNYFA